LNVKTSKKFAIFTLKIKIAIPLRFTIQWLVA